MKRMLTALGLTVGIVVATGSIAAEDPIHQRQAIMKNNGAAIGVLVRMAKGEMDFDTDKAHLALRIINSGMQGYGELFPEVAPVEAETRASEDIWKDMEGFQALATKLRTVTNEAVASPPAEQAAIGPLLNQVGGVCGECHQAFRISTN